MWRARVHTQAWNRGWSRYVQNGRPVGKPFSPSPLEGWANVTSRAIARRCTTRAFQAGGYSSLHVKCSDYDCQQPLPDDYSADVRSRTLEDLTSKTEQEHKETDLQEGRRDLPPQRDAGIIRRELSIPPHQDMPPLPAPAGTRPARTA